MTGGTEEGRRRSGGAPRDRQLQPFVNFTCIPVRAGLRYKWLHMIIAVSVVDKHRPRGSQHVGTYMFEIQLDADSSHFDLLALVCPKENEDEARPNIGKFESVNEILNPVRAVTDNFGNVVGWGPL